MDPVNTLKTNLSPAKLIGLAVGIVAILAIADAAGVTNWILFPYTTAKNKFSKSTTGAS